MKILNKTTILKTIPFDVVEVDLQREDLSRVSFYELNTNDWVNVIALTDDDQFVMIRQYRVGLDAFTLESPGGVIHKEEAGDIVAAGLRELEEETGYRCQKASLFLSLNPNPAIQTNRIHYVLGSGARLAKDRKLFPDRDEDITVELIPRSEIEKRVTSGEINHALCALGILAALRILRN